MPWTQKLLFCVHVINGQSQNFHDFDAAKFFNFQFWLFYCQAKSGVTLNLILIFAQNWTMCSVVVANFLWKKNVSSCNNYGNCCLLNNQCLLFDDNFIQFAATFLRKELCCPGAMTRRWAPPTRYTLRRNPASIIKDLIWFEVVNLNHLSTVSFAHATIMQHSRVCSKALILFFLLPYSQRHYTIRRSNVIILRHSDVIKCFTPVSSGVNILIQVCSILK